MADIRVSLRIIGLSPRGVQCAALQHSNGVPFWLPRVADRLWAAPPEVGQEVDVSIPIGSPANTASWLGMLSLTAYEMQTEARKGIHQWPIAI